MRAAESQPGASVSDRYHLCYALAKALEDRRNYEAAFAFYSRGNALKKSELKGDSEALIETLQRQKQVCTREFSSRGAAWLPQSGSIFIVGMPRAGSTLIEQILASHSRIDGTMELPDIPRLVHQFRDRVPGQPPATRPSSRI